MVMAAIPLVLKVRVSWNGWKRRVHCRGALLILAFIFVMKCCNDQADLSVSAGSNMTCIVPLVAFQLALSRYVYCCQPARAMSDCDHVLVCNLCQREQRLLLNACFEVVLPLHVRMISKERCTFECVTTFCCKVKHSATLVFFYNLLSRLSFAMQV